MLPGLFVLDAVLIALLPSTHGQPGGGGMGGSGPDGGGGPPQMEALPNGTSCNISGYSATYTETIDLDLAANLRTIVSTGCPNHINQCVGKEGICYDLVDGSSTNYTAARVQNYSIDIPLYPCFSDADGGTDISCEEDSLGIALTGVSIFGPGATGACLDAVDEEGDTFNVCGGHANPFGEYHYHVAPACLLDQMGDFGEVNENGQHSPQIGWAFDGFPMYGPHGVGGEYIYKCTDDRADPDDCLDECNGHMQHTVDGFKYHYHVTGPMGDLEGDIRVDVVSPLPGTDMHPYTLGCLKGVVVSGHLLPLFDGVSCASSGTTQDYVPKAVEGVVVVYPQKDLRDPPVIGSNTTSVTGTDSGASTVSYDWFFWLCLVTVCYV